MKISEEDNASMPDPIDVVIEKMTQEDILKLQRLNLAYMAGVVGVARRVAEKLGFGDAAFQLLAQILFINNVSVMMGEFLSYEEFPIRIASGLPWGKPDEQ